MSELLRGKVALVTGGSRGIGRATCIRFAAQGALVVVASRNVEASMALAATLGGGAFALPLDVTDGESVQAAIAELIARTGRVDVLVNNAGINADSTLLKLDEGKFDAVLDTSLGGTFRMARACAPHMVARESGVILNCSSVVATNGNFGQTNYVAAKQGIVGMTRVWARELGRKGVRVNCVAPGFIETEMTAKMPADQLAAMKQKTPLGRLGTPEDVARAYCFLASEDAAFINGQVLGVDGGLVIGT